VQKPIEISAVTASSAMAKATRAPSDVELIGGVWNDDQLLEGRVFDTVLADYLVGAIEHFDPHGQSQVCRRLSTTSGLNRL
jgi:hypothetical protein